MADKIDVVTLIEAYAAQGWTIATAESCTGGLIAAMLTDIPGSSAVFDRGFVTYSNASKRELLNVPEALLKTHGAVSEEVALAMATGAQQSAGTDIAISVTGIAGPGGGSNNKPVGLVFIGLAKPDGKTECWKYHFSGDRKSIREATRDEALGILFGAVQHK